MNKSPKEIWRWRCRNKNGTFIALEEKFNKDDIRYLRASDVELQKVELIADWVEEYKTEREADTALIRELVDRLVNSNRNEELIARVNKRLEEDTSAKELN